MAVMAMPNGTTVALDSAIPVLDNPDVAEEKNRLPIVSFRVQPEFKDQIEAAAKAEQLTESAFIRRTLAARINEMAAKGELR